MLTPLFVLFGRLIHRYTVGCWDALAKFIFVGFTNAQAAALCSLINVLLLIIILLYNHTDITSILHCMCSCVTIMQCTLQQVDASLLLLHLRNLTQILGRKHWFCHWSFSILHLLPHLQDSRPIWDDLRDVFSLLLWSFYAAWCDG